MPYPLTHLIVAHSVMDHGLNVDDPGLFYLGALGPDAVHFREGFSDRDKESSHLYSGDQPWGRGSTNTSDWMHAAHAKRRAWNAHPDQSFVLGYLSHVYLDILNYNLIFLSKEEPGVVIQQPERYWSEQLTYDYQLLDFCKKAVFPALASAECREYIDLISADELSAIQHNILHCQYEKAPAVEEEIFDYRILDGYDAFLHTTAKEIAAMLIGD